MASTIVHWYCGGALYRNCYSEEEGLMVAKQGTPVELVHVCERARKIAGGCCCNLDIVLALCAMGFVISCIKV